MFREKKAPFVFFAIFVEHRLFFRFTNDLLRSTFDPDSYLKSIVCQHRLRKLKNYWN